MDCRIRRQHTRFGNDHAKYGCGRHDRAHLLASLALDVDLVDYWYGWFLGIRRFLALQATQAHTYSVALAHGSTAHGVQLR